jgi:hypothetical protein
MAGTTIFALASLTLVRIFSSCHNKEILTWRTLDHPSLRHKSEYGSTTPLYVINHVVSTRKKRAASRIRYIVINIQPMRTERDFQIEVQQYEQ